MMSWLKENWFRAGILLVILIAGISVFYYYVIFLPQKEQTRIDQQKQEQFEKTLKEDVEKTEAKRQTALNSLLLDACFADARANYETNWANSCKTEAKKISTGYQNCINDSGGSSCRSIWGTADASADCSLPTAIAQRWDETQQKAKDECFKKYPQ